MYIVSMCPLLGYIIVLAAFVDGARRINVQTQMLRARRSLSEHTGNPSSLMGLGRGEDLHQGQQVKMSRGTRKTKFQETFDGLPIVGATVVVEEDKKGRLTGVASGQLVGDLDDDIPSSDPRLSVDEVFHMAARHNRDDPNTVNFDPTKDAQLEVMLDDSLDDNVRARLVYKVSYRVESSEKLSRPFTLVDANTGDIIKTWEGLSINRIASKERVRSNYKTDGVGGNLKMGKAAYDGKDYPKLMVTKTENGTCILKNNVARVYHCNNSWSCYREVDAPFTFDCETGFDDKVNGAYSPLNDALFYITATYQMFDKWYGIKNPLERPGSDDSFCSARVHFGTAFENAFWDGYFITFGDGNSTFYPLTSINVVAHEIAHGVTEMNSGLYYWGESGGMNEAFSDMAGEAVEFFASQEYDWMIGFEIFKDPKKALRYFSDPAEDGRSIGGYKQYCPGMDPHFSSGLFNRAFYFLGETKGWDIKKAFHPFVVANELYWRADSRFYEAACDVVEAARDLELNADDVIEAFRKVGLEPCKNTATGLVATAEISAPAGHEIIIEVNVKDATDVDTVKIKTWGGRMDINVRTPKCTHCSRKASYWGNQIDICDTPPGKYEIRMLPKNDLVKGGVAIFGPSSYIVQNLTIENKNVTKEVEFSMPDTVVKNGEQVLMRMEAEYGYVAGLIRHGQPPDLKSFEYDYYISTWREALICDTKPGTWYLTMKTWDRKAYGINVEIVRVLTGTRMDTPPPPTRRPPKPTPESSGDGSGSDMFI